MIYSQLEYFRLIELENGLKAMLISDVNNLIEVDCNNAEEADEAMEVLSQDDNESDAEESGSEGSGAEVRRRFLNSMCI